MSAPPPLPRQAPPGLRSPPIVVAPKQRQSKTWLIVIVVAVSGLVLTLGVLGFVTLFEAGKQSEHRRAAIHSVMVQAAEATEGAYNKRVLIKEFRSIDVSTCPEDFRIAWVQMI